MFILAHPTARLVRRGSRFTLVDGPLELGFVVCGKDPRHGTPYFAAHANLPLENGVHPVLAGDFADLRAACAFVLTEGVAV